MSDASIGGGHAGGLGGGREFVEVEAFSVLGIRGRVGTNVVRDVWAGVIEVGCVVAAVGVHVVDVGLVVDVGVEDLEVGEGMGKGVEGVENREGDPGGEVTDAAPVKINVVDICGGDAASGVDDSVVAFGGGEVELEYVDDRRA